MNLFINITGAVILGLLAYFIIRVKSRTKRINDFFCNAARVFALINENDARVAIITTATVTSKKQRGSMVNYLRSMASDMRKVSENNPETKSHIYNISESLDELAEEISSREWAIVDVIKQKEELKNINPDYLAALDKADSTIFAQKHPELFK